MASASASPNYAKFTLLDHFTVLAIGMLVVRLAHTGSVFKRAQRESGLFTADPFNVTKSDGSNPLPREWAGCIGNRQIVNP